MKPLRFRGATTMARWPSQRPAGTHQHDPPHWPTADALDAGEQFHLPRATAAAVVPHAANGQSGCDSVVVSLGGIRVVLPGQAGRGITGPLARPSRSMAASG
jgi:hypothetical protein